MKDHVKCPQCGFRVDASATQCPNCRTRRRLPPTPPAEAAASVEVTTADAYKFELPLGLLGFFLPVAGMFRHIFWEREILGLLLALASGVFFILSLGRKPLLPRPFGIGALTGLGFALVMLLILPHPHSREGARRASCQSALKQLALVSLQFASANNGRLPDLSSPAAIQKQLQPYAKGPEIFICLSDHQPYLGNPKLSGKAMKTVEHPAQTVLFFERDAPHLEGRNVAFADGHVKWQNAERWKEIERRMKNG